MKVTVTFRHMDASDPIRDYASDKLQRLEKYLEAPIEVHVILEVVKFMHRAEVDVHAKGVHLSAEEVTADMYAALDKVADKIERQAQKHKEQIKSHH